MPYHHHRLLPAQLSGQEQLRLRHVLPGRPTELGRLRRWLTSLLKDIPARDDVVLVAVELAANAIKHTASGAGGYLTVEVTPNEYRDTMRIAVADDGADSGPVWPVSSDPLDGHGLGLRMVRAVATCTGAIGDTSGRCVWAEVPWPGAAGEPEPAAGVGRRRSLRPGPERANWTHIVTRRFR